MDCGIRTIRTVKWSVRSQLPQANKKRPQPCHHHRSQSQGSLIVTKLRSEPVIFIWCCFGQGASLSDVRRGYSTRQQQGQFSSPPELLSSKPRFLTRRGHRPCFGHLASGGITTRSHLKAPHRGNGGRTRQRAICRIVSDSILQKKKPSPGFSKHCFK